MGEYKHWCGNCQIRIYIQRHYGRTLTWKDCPYNCEYAKAMRRSAEMKGEQLMGRNYYPNDCPTCGADMRGYGNGE